MTEAAAHQIAPSCREDAGVLVPEIDFARCEGKSDCAVVCPYDVFEVRVATKDERRGLSFLANLKSLAHGHEKAFVIHPDQCHACGLCVAACPEHAIRLVSAARAAAR